MVWCGNVSNAMVGVVSEVKVVVEVVQVLV